MLGLIKLERARVLLEHHLPRMITDLEFEPRLARIKVVFRDGTILFVRYNNHNEYSYSVMFSQLQYDRCRFDNYDDTWKVSTPPHHFHPRRNNQGFESPMRGDPERDIPLLCDLLKKGKLLHRDWRF